jgi:hypothetical protein
MDRHVSNSSMIRTGNKFKYLPWELIIQSVNSYAQNSLLLPLFCSSYYYTPAEKNCH